MGGELELSLKQSVVLFKEHYVVIKETTVLNYRIFS
jgi:hypothetical protein